MAVDLKTFEKVAASLRGLVKDGPVALRILRPFSPYALDFDIYFRDDAVASAVEASGLDRPTYRQAVENVEQVIASIIQGTTLPVEDDEDADDSEVVEAKKKCVQENFDVEELRKRAWVKETSKSDVLFETGWEVSIKQSDETKMPPSEVPVPIGQLLLKSAGLRNPFAMFTGADTTEMILTTDRSDLKAMMETIRRLDRALAAAEADDTSGVGNGETP
jgi:hypothetical protein